MRNSRRKRRRTGTWTTQIRVRSGFANGSCLEADEEPEDTTIRTYENAVTLYEDKQYYPDAEDVGVESVE